MVIKMHEIDNLSELIQNTYLPIMRGEVTVGEYYINSDVANQLAAHLITNDVAIQKHGAWISFLDGDHIMPERYYRCSCCKSIERRNLPYCPWCGAKMDLR